MTRLLIALLLLLSAGEITGLLDAALAADCTATCAGDDAEDAGAGCALCPCCHQGRLLAAGTGVVLGALSGVVRLVEASALQLADRDTTGIFHPPKAAGA